METVDSHPGTAPAELIDRLAQSRACLTDLLAATAGPVPDQPSQVPPVLLPFATRWVITHGLAWTAERRRRIALRVVMGHDPAELADKLAAIEAEAGGFPLPGEPWPPSADPAS